MEGNIYFNIDYLTGRSKSVSNIGYIPHSPFRLTGVSDVDSSELYNRIVQIAPGMLVLVLNNVDMAPGRTRFFSTGDEACIFSYSLRAIRKHKNREYSNNSLTIVGLKTGEQDEREYKSRIACELHVSINKEGMAYLEKNELIHQVNMSIIQDLLLKKYKVKPNFNLCAQSHLALNEMFEAIQTSRNKFIVTSKVYGVLSTLLENPIRLETKKARMFTADEAVAVVMDALEDNPLYAVEELCQLVGKSPNSMNRAFTKLRGETLTKYSHAIKMDWLANELKISTSTLADYCDVLDYANPKALGRALRTHQKSQNED